MCDGTLFALEINMLRILMATFLITPLWAAESSKEHLENLQFRQQISYFYNLSFEVRAVLTREVVRAQRADNGLVKLQLGEVLRPGKVVIMHGLDFHGQEFVEPFHIAMLSGRETYFFKYSKFDSYESNLEMLKAELKKLQKTGEEVQIVAHCTGGVFAIDLLDRMKLAGESLHQLKLATVATPISGYDAPDNIFPWFAAPFVGRTTISVGIGLKGKFHAGPIGQCEQWITTDCSLDIHACPYGKIQQPQMMDPQPCAMIHYLPGHTHHNGFTFVLRKLLLDEN